MMNTKNRKARVEYAAFRLLSALNKCTVTQDVAPSSWELSFVEARNALRAAVYEYDDGLGFGYALHEIPNDAEGQAFVTQLRRHLNRSRFTLRVRGQHVKDEVQGYDRVRAHTSHAINDCTHVRVYLDQR